MASVVRHLVSRATRRAGLPVLGAPFENGPLPGSVGGIARPFPVSAAAEDSSDEEWDDDEDILEEDAEEGDEESDVIAEEFEDELDADGTLAESSIEVFEPADDSELSSFADLNNNQVSTRAGSHCASPPLDGGPHEAPSMGLLDPHKHVLPLASASSVDLLLALMNLILPCIALSPVFRHSVHTHDSEIRSKLTVY